MTDASRDRDEIVEVIRDRLLEDMGLYDAEKQANDILSALEAKGYVVEKVSASHGIRHRREGFEDGTGSASPPHPSRDATKGEA